MPIGSNFRQGRNGLLLPTSLQSSYEGASRGARYGGWQASSAGPNTAIGGALTTLRSRQRQQTRDNPTALSAREQYVTNVIGTGIRPKLSLENPELQQKIMTWWGYWIHESDFDERANFYGQQELSGHAMFDSGECLARQVIDNDPNLPVPLKIQLLETDHLDAIGDRQLKGGRRIRQGIEIDQRGKKAAYHLSKSHPGEIHSDGIGSIRVLAKDIAHVFRSRRPGQLRGVPHLHAAMRRLYDLDQYQDAELERKKQAAMLVGFLTNNTGDMNPSDVFPLDEGERDWVEARLNYYGQLGQIKSGSWNMLAPGDDIRFNDPGDVGTGYQDFTHENKRDIAAGAGITFEQLTGHMKNVNYSSARVRLIDIRRGFEMDQQNVFAHQFCRVVWRWWITLAVASGRLQIPDWDTNRYVYLNPEWVPDAFEAIDPLKDSLADLNEVRAGFASRPGKQVERGKDPDVLDQEIERDNQNMDRRKFQFDSDPRKQSKSGVVQPYKAEEETTDE